MLAALGRLEMRKPPCVSYRVTQPLRSREPKAEGMLPVDADFNGIRVAFTKTTLGGYEANVSEDGGLLVAGMKIMKNVDSMPVQTKCGTVAFTLAAGKPEDRIELKVLE